MTAEWLPCWAGHVVAVRGSNTFDADERERERMER